MIASVRCRCHQTGRPLPLDVALLQLSPPDRHGLCTLGTSVDAARAAADHATTIIAEINTQMPRTLGATTIPLSRVHACIRTNRPLHAHTGSPETEIEGRIGDAITPLVEDGATLQMGIGSIPDAVLRRLVDKRDLGVHTEMFSDGLVALHEAGVVTNARKVLVWRGEPARADAPRTRRGARVRCAPGLPGRAPT